MREHLDLSLFSFVDHKIMHTINKQLVTYNVTSMTYMQQVFLDHSKLPLCLEYLPLSYIR
jgi:hypothetical protein